MANGSFDDVALFPKAAAVCSAALGDERGNAFRSQSLPVWFGIVTAIGQEHFGTMTRPADAALNVRDGVYQRKQLGDVVTAGGSKDDG